MNTSALAHRSVPALRGEDPSQLDEESFKVFCREQYVSLFRMLCPIFGDRWLAEEVAQETLSRAWADWNRVSRLDKPELWTKRVALNLVRSGWRRRRVSREALARIRSVRAVTPCDGSVVEALASLPERQRVAVTLRYLLDKPIAETAEIMRCRPGTVKALTSQGVGRLRNLLSVTEVTNP